MTFVSLFTSFSYELYVFQLFPFVQLQIAYGCIHACFIVKQCVKLVLSYVLLVKHSNPLPPPYLKIKKEECCFFVVLAPVGGSNLAET